MSATCDMPHKFYGFIYFTQVAYEVPSFSAFTLLVGWQEGHTCDAYPQRLSYRTSGGWRPNGTQL